MSNTTPPRTAPIATEVCTKTDVFVLELVDAPSEPAFDNLTLLASRFLRTPRAFITIVQPELDRQFFKSQVGLDKVDSNLSSVAARQTPLSHSISQHVVNTAAAVVINDTRKHPEVSVSPAVKEWNVLSYLGVPIHLPNGTVIGALCVMDTHTRHWMDSDTTTLLQLAVCVDEQIALKQAMRDAKLAREVAQNAARAREVFLAHMAHEIRTPLNGIIGAVDLMSANTKDRQTQSDPSDDSFSDLLRTLETSSDGLLRILNDALDMAKIDSGKLQLERIPFCPVDVCREIVDLFEPAAQAKNVAVRAHWHGTSADQMRLGDAFRLRQVLTNLLSNATKFTDTGGIDVTFSGDANRLIVTISDTGCGMAETEIADMFSPYTQAEPSVARRKGGTGLGLPIVKKLVDLMQGNIAVSAHKNVGTTFTVSLPMPVVAAPKQAATAATADTDLISPLHGTRVLVADDSAVNRLLLSKMLTSLGAHVVQAGDGRTALTKALDQRFGYLFIDIQMPDMSGDQTAKQLLLHRQDDPTKTWAKMIAVTANVFPEQLTQYRRAGFDACLAKPIRRADIVTVLNGLSAKTPA